MILLPMYHNLPVMIGLLVGILMVFFSCFFHVLGISYSFFKFHRKSSTKISNNAKELPGISIIKPLIDIDPHLERNLETFFRLNYPHFELLFCVQQYNQALLNILERLRSRYPNVQAQIFIGSNSSIEQSSVNIIEETDEDTALLINGSNESHDDDDQRKLPWCERMIACGQQRFSKRTGSSISKSHEVKNPKIANMMSGYAYAQYPYILISDSGMTMREDTLYDMNSAMDDDVGLVHQMPFTCDKVGFAGSLEKVYFGTQHARMYMALNLIGISCVTGMSCLIRKKCLDNVGGLRMFGDYIAEDYYIAHEISRQGWRIRVASQPGLQNAGEYSIKLWTQRMIRWCKLRTRLSLFAYFEPFQECFPSAIATGLVTNYLFNWNTLVIIACHVLVWFILDYSILRITQGGSLPFRKSEFAVAWLTREITAYYIYFKAFTGPAIVQWRGKKYRLGSGTRAELIDSPTVPEKCVDVPLFRIDSQPSGSSSPVNKSAVLSV